MAAPNIVNVKTITGRSAFLVASTAPQDLLVNAASSNNLYKVNSIMAANVNGGTAASITVYISRASSEFRLASTILVPANASLVVVSKDVGLYMEEGDTLKVIASANNFIHITCSYEFISSVN